MEVKSTFANRIRASEDELRDNRALLNGRDYSNQRRLVTYCLMSGESHKAMVEKLSAASSSAKPAVRNHRDASHSTAGTNCADEPYPGCGPGALGASLFEDHSTSFRGPYSAQEWSLSHLSATSETREPVASPFSTSCIAKDPWTRAGWDVSFVLHLFDNLVNWDYLPFCLLCKEAFLSDYVNGRNRYCSSALVNAILALACRYLGDNGGGPKPSFDPNSSASESFYTEAESLLLNLRSLHNGLDHIPDIQALGLLALYQVGCGHEAKAQELGEDCLASITDLCLNNPVDGTEEQHYLVVRATTFCGATTLVR